MKYALTFFLTLAFAVLAQAHPEAQYKTSTTNGCKVFLTYEIDSTNAPTWSGQCKLGFAEGYGVLKFPTHQFGYEGEMIRGMFEGNVTYGNDDDMFIIKYESGWPIYASHTTTAEGAFELEIAADGTITDKKIKNENHPELGWNNQGKSDSSGGSQSGSQRSTSLESIPKTCNQTYTSYGIGVGMKYPQPSSLLGYVQSIFSSDMQLKLTAKYSSHDFEKVQDLIKLTSDDWSEVSKYNDIRTLEKIDGIPSDPSYRDNPFAQEAMELGHDNLNEAISCWKSVAAKKKAYTPVKAKDAAANQTQSAAKPFTNRDCIDFKQYATDKISDSFKILHNRCGVEVQVMYCMYEREKEHSTCDTLGEGLKGWGLVTVAKNADQWTADVVGTTWLVKYIVCEEANGCRFPRKGDNLYPTTKSSLGY